MHFVLSTHNSQGISYHKYLHSVLIRTFAFASYQPANQAPADSESGFHAIHTFLMRHVPGWYHILARTLSPKRGGHFLLELAHLGAVFELLLFSLIWCDSTQIHFLKARKKKDYSLSSSDRDCLLSVARMLAVIITTSQNISVLSVIILFATASSLERGREERREREREGSSAWTVVLAAQTDTLPPCPSSTITTRFNS